MTKLFTLAALTLTILAGTAVTAQADTYNRTAPVNHPTSQAPSQAHGQNYTLGQLHPAADWAQDPRGAVNDKADLYISSEKSVRQRNALISSTGLNGNYGVFADSAGNVIGSDRMSTKDRYGSVGASNDIERYRSSRQTLR